MGTDATAAGNATVLRRRHEVWQFTPIREFLSRADRWMYRSFVISLIGVIGLSFAVCGIVLVAAGFAAARIGVITWALTAVVTTTATVLWFIRGVDLRTGKARLELFAMLAVLALQVGCSWQLHDQLLRRLAIISTFAVLLVATMFGPIWMVLVHISSVVALGHILGTLAPSWFQTLLLAVLSGFYWFSVKITIWYIDVMRDLYQARHIERRLAITDERLRFADDLHDVIGRSLAIISMQAELADQLVARGDTRAHEHLQKVRAEAAQTMTQMRSLVRGYREPALITELRGACELLQSAGMEVTIHGQEAEWDSKAAALAGYFVREAVTNVLRHSQASRVVIALTANTITISNNKPLSQVPTPELITPSLGNADRTAGTGVAAEQPQPGSGIETLRRKLVESGLGRYEDVQIARSAQWFTIRMELTELEAADEA